MIKNITFTAEESIIHQARTRARLENVTLNELFRQWLEQYVSQPSAANRYDELMDKLSYANAGHKFSRDEMNERG